MAAPTLSVDPKEIDAALDSEFKALSQRVRRATESVGRSALLLPARDATARALRSNKLPTTWRATTYPAAGVDTLAPAFVVKTKAPKIIAAFAEGAKIVPTGGRRYLWIPTENVPASSGGRRLSPKEIDRRFRRSGKARAQSAFTFARDGSGNLIAFVMANSGVKRLHRKAGDRYVHAFKKATKKDPGQRVAMFILVKQVRLAKRLDLAAIAEAAGGRYAIAYKQAAEARA
jgi:hypothetical protein